MSTRSSLDNASNASLHAANELAHPVELPVPADGSFAIKGVEGMRPIAANEKVPKHAHVIKDKRTGQHYVTPPKFSLAKAKNAAKTERHEFNHPVGLSQAFSTSKAPSRVSQDSTRAGNATAHTEAGTAQLLEQLRHIVRQEVTTAHAGHKEQVEQIVANTDQLQNQLRAIEQTDQLPLNGSDSKSRNGSATTDGKIDFTDAALPQVAARGGMDALTVDEDEDDEDEFPNWWAKWRYNLREPFAEFMGTAVLMIFGNGINVQVTVSKLYDPENAKGDYLSISFGWGLGVLFGVTLAGGISGGHINPALTLALAVWRRFPWRKVPVYICAQMAGALVGSLMIYGLYVVPIRLVDPMQTETTAALFTTYPAEFLRTQSTRITTFYNEVFATAVLAAVVFALGDSNNTPPPEGMAPLILMWLIMAIGATLGWQSAYCVNPARDWGPRMMLTMVGYEGLWSFNAGYFAWTPLLATVVGAQTGAFLYDALIYTGGDSPLNRPWRWSRVRWPSSSRKQLPASIS